MSNDIIQVLDDPQNLYQGNLRSYLPIICQAPNINYGYHNLNHMLHVACVSYSALEFYNNKSELPNISRRDGRSLIIAALFHDYDHTGQPGPDSINIKRAIAGLKDNVLEEDRPHLAAIVGAIEATEFPAQRPQDDIPLINKMIEDADISQVFHTAWIGETALGLGKELGKNIPEMLENQISFLSNLEFKTDFGRTTYSQQTVDAKIDETQRLLGILKTF